MSVPQELQAARLKLVLQMPYIATALWQLVPIEMPNMSKVACGPIGVDKWWRLYYDPELLAKTPIPQLAAILYHEVNHLLRQHHERFEHETKQGNAQLANIAGDCEINDDISQDPKQPMYLPEWVVMPKSFGLPNALLAEDYFERLKKDAKKITIKIGVASGNCGSCATGNDGEPGEQGKPNDGSDGAAKTAKGISAGEGELIKRAVAEDIETYAKQSRGTVPAGLARWADVLLHPKIDWRKELSASIRHSLTDIKGQVDYSYRKPSRRQSALPEFVLPSMRQPVPHVAVVVDTSGSISQEMLTTACSEIQGILKAVGGNHIGFVSVDAEVNFSGNVRSVSKVKAKLRGGGGTDMRLGINAAREQRPRPHLIILLTDGYTPWPDQPLVGSRLTVVLTSGNQEIPKWAKKIVIDTKE